MFHRVYLEYPQPTTFTFIFSLHRIPSTYFCSHHTNYFSYNTITLVHYFCLTVLIPSLLTPGVCNSFFEIPWVGLLWKYWHESSRDRTRDCDNMDSAKNSEGKNNVHLSSCVSANPYNNTYWYWVASIL